MSEDFHILKNKSVQLLVENLKSLGMYVHCEEELVKMVSLNT